MSPSEASRGHFRKEQKRERYLCSPTDKIKTYPTDCWLRNAVRGHAQTFYYYAKRHERKKISSGREPQLKDFYYPIGLALVAEKNHDDSSVFFYRTSPKKELLVFDTRQTTTSSRARPRELNYLSFPRHCCHAKHATNLYRKEINRPLPRLHSGGRRFRRNQFRAQKCHFSWSITVDCISRHQGREWVSHGYGFGSVAQYTRTCSNNDRRTRVRCFPEKVSHNERRFLRYVPA